MHDSQLDRYLTDRCKEDQHGCWIWQNHTNQWGYGLISNQTKAAIKYGTRKAHRLAYINEHGSIPPAPNHEIMHTCDVPQCINPAHLVAGTHKQNMEDAAKKGRMRRGSGQPHSVLTEELAYAIKYTRRLDRLVDLAKEYGVAYETVSACRNGYSWKHI